MSMNCIYGAISHNATFSKLSFQNIALAVMLSLVNINGLVISEAYEDSVSMYVALLRPFVNLIK